MAILKIISQTLTAHRVKISSISPPWGRKRVCVKGICATFRTFANGQVSCPNMASILETAAHRAKIKALNFDPCGVEKLCEPFANDKVHAQIWQF